MPSISHGFTSHFPITSRLNPLQKGNLKYLFASAVVTRFAISFVRIDRNRPERVHSEDLTAVEKKRAFAERAFIETVGTACYILLLHVGQDIAAKFFEWKYRDLLKNTKIKALQELKEGNFGIDSKHFGEAYDRAHNNLNTRNIINNMLYEGNSLKRISKKRFCQKLGVPLTQPLPKAIAEQSKVLNFMCFGALLFGVLLSTVAGGSGIQWFNDHILNKYLKQRYPEVVPAGYLSLSSAPEYFNNKKINPFAFQLPSSVGEKVS